jgi:hypothetical protein
MRRLLTAALCAVALTLPACSGKQAPPPADTETGSNHGSLAECLRSQGVSEASGPAAVLGPPAGVDPAKWDAAMKACATFAPGPAG